ELATIVPDLASDWAVVRTQRSCGQVMVSQFETWFCKCRRRAFHKRAFFGTATLFLSRRPGFRFVVAARLYFFRALASSNPLVLVDCGHGHVPLHFVRNA